MRSVFAGCISHLLFQESEPYKFGCIQITNFGKHGSETVLDDFLAKQIGEAAVRNIKSQWAFAYAAIHDPNDNILHGTEKTNRTADHLEFFKCTIHQLDTYFVVYKG